MSAASRHFDCANKAKAKFDDIYNAPDPRGYYQTLGDLGYCIPSEAKPIFRKVIDMMGRDRLKIVDIGCSYGVNAAMIRYDLTFEDLVERYAESDMSDRSIAEVIVQDAEEFSEASAAVNAAFVGVDVAGEAAGYAKAVGLIDEAVIENLEQKPLSNAAAALVADADLIITTGAVGYVTERTFSRIIDAVEGEAPWVAAFALRQFPFDAIADSLAGRGLRTEQLEDRYFEQRAFRDETEAKGAIEAVRAAGRDPEGLESTGRYFADFFLARPEGAPGSIDALAHAS